MLEPILLIQLSYVFFVDQSSKLEIVSYSEDTNEKLFQLKLYPAFPTLKTECKSFYLHI